MCKFIQVCGAITVVGLGVLEAEGQIIQIPRLNSYSARTAVRVPDRGAAYIGGIHRSFQSSSQSGTPLVGRLPGWKRLFGNRASGASDSAIGASVHVTIIDHESLDQQVLAEAKRRRAVRSGSASDPATARPTGFSRRLSRQVQADAGQRERLMSVAEIRRRNAERRKSKEP